MALTTRLVACCLDMTSGIELGLAERDGLVRTEADFALAFAFALGGP